MCIIDYCMTGYRSSFDHGPWCTVFFAWLTALSLKKFGILLVQSLLLPKLGTDFPVLGCGASCMLCQGLPYTAFTLELACYNRSRFLSLLGSEPVLVLPWSVTLCCLSSQPLVVFPDISKFSNLTVVHVMQRLVLKLLVSISGWSFVSISWIVWNDNVH